MKKPSVTELISLLDKPALLRWANNIGLIGISLDAYRSKLMNDGTSIHKQIELFLIDGTPMLDHEINEKCISFFSDKEIISIEKKLVNDYFIGRLDVKFKHNGIVHIADFKSNQKNIYLENKLQLSAYRMIDGCDKVCVISVPDFTLIPIDNINFEACEEIMINLSKIYFLKNTV